MSAQGLQGSHTSVMSMPGKKKKRCVAILDDLEDDLQFATSSLERFFDVQAFRTGRDLLDYLGREKADLLLISADLATDYSLSVLADIRARWPKTPIILIRRKSTLIQERREHYDKLAQAFISKPFDSNDLSDLVQATITQSSGSAKTSEKKKGRT